MKDPLTHLRGKEGTLCGKKGFVTNLDKNKRPSIRNWIESNTRNVRYQLVFGGKPTCQKCLEVYQNSVA